MPGPPGDPHDDLLGTHGGEGFTSRLERWSADRRVDAAAERRSRERWLADAAGRDATLVGVLLDLAERQVQVAVTLGGRTRHGHLGAVGADFVALIRREGELVIALSAVTSLRVTDRAPAALGDRVQATDLLLVDVLQELAQERARVRIVDHRDAVVAGELRRVGTDVLVVRPEGAGSGTTYVPLAAVGEVQLA